ncbi:thioredoxin-like domain-containing protein [Pseudomarimonas salicorniae]|uniref:Redoxin domain-containing protein n=1 Tax=Pseudomarimonas salicorniae TaxID=2933270 RepID=A0ABT0GEJ9_9GAMM|nr:thioredoxin-like domain-containing protein [Lysobacter sp. CAU 1642]MCK7592966.1 redoxin domain-containing protein [Lysobacter sp. CAU 1642]
MSVPAQAPEFPASLEWINCDPLRMSEQRGRAVALVFWSASSAYCHNLLDDLGGIATRHADGLTVVAVHTPKFEAERDQRIALKALNRLGCRLPAAHDKLFLLWQHFEVKAWPTVILIDASGAVQHRFVGDHQRGAIDLAVQGLLDSAGPQQRVFGAQVQAYKPEPRMPLAFPAGLAVGPSHLYVADTAHHRILECSHEGRILRTFGSGTPGYVDGHPSECSFNGPRGLHLTRDALFVADTGNHTLRRIALLNGESDTIAGTGQRRQTGEGQGSSPSTTALDTPWAVTGSNDKLYFTQAAAQQVWEYDQVSRSLRCLVGTGQIGFGDGVGDRAMLAQPAGLALVQQSLYVADSAASAIRSVHVSGGQIHSLIGHGLFEFGRQDGPRQSALLQYPLDVAMDPKSPQLWIADTYNSQIRYLRLGGGDLRSLQLDYVLHEPSAIAAGSGALWVANSNSHEVVRIDMESRQVQRLPIGE